MVPVPISELGKGRTLRADAWRRLRKNKLAVGALIWIAIIILIAISADLWVPRYLGDPIDIDTTTASAQSLQPPSWDHPFGTDRMARDITVPDHIRGSGVADRRSGGGRDHGWHRIDHGGARRLLRRDVGHHHHADGGYLLRLPVRALCDRADGRSRAGACRTCSLPSALLGWPSIARVFRSSILSVKENEYVDAARAMGASTRRILFRHIMPNAIAPIIVYATMSIGGAILTEAALSFLGMGVRAAGTFVGQHAGRSRGLHVHCALAHDLPGYRDHNHRAGLRAAWRWSARRPRCEDEGVVVAASAGSRRSAYAFLHP